MDNPIRITAEVLQHDRSSCRFTVDRPLYRGFARCTTPKRAQGSSLPERLFAIDGITAVILQDQQVTVTHTATVDWRAAGPPIGAAIRAHILSGQPAVSEEAQKQVPAEDILRQRIQGILDEQINPAIAAHGGTISLLDVRGTTVFIQMGGGCQGCSSASATLREGVETTLRANIPEIGEILDTTDHAAGQNPYYAAAAH